MDAKNVEVARDAQSAETAFSGNPGFATVQKGPANEGSLPPARLGRKKVVTPERQEFICKLLAKGETERAACLRAGIGETAWNEAKKVDAVLRARIAEARDRWAELRHRQHVAAVRESQWDRSANRKPLRPAPTKQANMVVWHLVRRVPLHFAAIPASEIEAACERFSLTLATWQRQEQAFGLMKKVYAQRAKIRGEQTTVRPRFDLSAFASAESGYGDDEFARFQP